MLTTNRNRRYQGKLRSSVRGGIQTDSFRKIRP
jgi:hypothetical protein